MYDIYLNRVNRKSVILATGVDMPTVVRMTNLDPNEVAWAIEEEGRCQTEMFTIFASCKDCMDDGLKGNVLPLALLQDMTYIHMIDEFCDKVMRRTKGFNEFESALNLFAIQVQRECGYDLHPDDLNSNGETLQ